MKTLGTRALHELNPVYTAGSSMLSLARQLDFNIPVPYIGRPDWRKVKHQLVGFAARSDQKRADTIARYTAALSRDDWRGAKDLAERLDTCTVSVAKTLRQPHMTDLVEKCTLRSERGVAYFVWRLK